MKAATTLLEISKILKLSPSTVSRALKNHPDIAPATRDKVLQLANKLDYEPNLNAVGLRTSKTKEIAVIVPGLSGFFYDSFISAVEDECRKAGYSPMILLSGDNPEIENENLKICKQRRVQGVLVCLTPNTTNFDSFARLEKLEIAVVYFDKVPQGEEFTTVRVGDEEAAQLAAEELITKGKKKVLSLFGDLKMSISSRRLLAYKDAFAKAGKDNSYVVEYATSSRIAEHLTMKAFASPDKPDAIFCMSDEILIGVMKAVQRVKIRYPEDTGIIAISNGFFPTLYSPEITYVETSGYKLGQLAFTTVLQRINEQNPSRDNALSSQLVVKESI
jgi:LacI family transcriptional regulator